MYEKMYFHLFNAITDALKQMEKQNYGQAAQTLKESQQAAEELFIDCGAAVG